jgi:hypothetical protein
MSLHRRIRLPISTRHAFALAFDLAARRDAWSSLIVPLILRSPWILALAVLPEPSQSENPGLVMLITAVALIGDFVMLVVVGAMLRFRARSVFNTAVQVRPAPAGECYSQGLRRVPWLIVTEILRNLILFASFVFVLPFIYLGFRLSFATEAVVLHEPHTEAAFRRSFRITPGRFERWLEMIAVSVLLVLAVVFVPTVLSVLFRGLAFPVWLAIMRLLVTAITPIIQYAWTFFYLRLVEIDAPMPVIEPGPLYAAAAVGGRIPPAPAPMIGPRLDAPAPSAASPSRPDAPRPAGDASPAEARPALVHADASADEPNA